MQKIQKFFSTVTFRIVASIYEDMLFFALVVYFFFLNFFCQISRKIVKPQTWCVFFKEQRIFFF